jgi:hypothetical protein
MRITVFGKGNVAGSRTFGSRQGIGWRGWAATVVTYQIRRLCCWRCPVERSSARSRS